MRDPAGEEKCGFRHIARIEPAGAEKVAGMIQGHDRHDEAAQHVYGNYPCRCATCTAMRPAEELAGLQSALNSCPDASCGLFPRSCAVLSVNLAVKNKPRSGSGKRAKIAAAFATMRSDAWLGVPIVVCPALGQ